jgi:hypothetical protein
MKKTKDTKGSIDIGTLILILLASLFLTSCGKFSDGTSVWQSGLWIIAWLCPIGIALLAWSGYRSSKSGDETPDPNYPGGWRYSDNNVPFIKTWQENFIAILFVF